MSLTVEIPDGTRADVVLSALGLMPCRSNPLSFRGLCPLCDHSTVQVQVLPDEGHDVIGSCRNDRCHASLPELVPDVFRGAGVVPADFPQERCERPRGLWLAKLGDDDLLMTVACRSRRSDPEGCGRVFEERWADFTAGVFPNGAVMFTVEDTPKERDRVSKALRRKQAPWVAIPSGDSERTYFAAEPASSVEWTEVREPGPKASELLEAMPHESSRNVSWSKSQITQTWRRCSAQRFERRGYFDPRADLDMIGDTLGFDAGDGLLRLDRWEPSGKAAAARHMAGVRVHDGTRWVHTDTESRHSLDALRLLTPDGGVAIEQLIGQVHAEERVHEGGIWTVDLEALLHEIEMIPSSTRDERLEIDVEELLSDRSPTAGGWVTVSPPLTATIEEPESEPEPEPEPEPGRCPRAAYTYQGRVGGREVNGPPIAISRTNSWVRRILHILVRGRSRARDRRAD